MNKMIHDKSFNDQNIMLWIYFLFCWAEIPQMREQTEVDIQTIYVVRENEHPPKATQQLLNWSAKF
jgi:hypothetical protein